MDRGFTPYGEMYSNYGSGDGEAKLDLFAGTTDNFDRGVMWDTPNRELSSVGRWLSPDPARTGWNQYAYPIDPNSNTDPTGLCNTDIYGQCYVVGQDASRAMNPMNAQCISVDGGGACAMFTGSAFDYANMPVRVFGCREGVCDYYRDPFSFINFANNCQAPFLCNPVPAKPKKAGPTPLKWWEKAGMVISCVAGMDPEFATPMGATESQPSDSTDSTNTTEGQGPPSGPNKGGRTVPYGGSPEVPSTVAGGAAYGSGVGQCITNVFTTWPK